MEILLAPTPIDLDKSTYNKDVKDGITLRYTSFDRSGKLIPTRLLVTGDDNVLLERGACPSAIQHEADVDRVANNARNYFTQMKALGSISVLSVNEKSIDDFMRGIGENPTEDVKHYSQNTIVNSFLRSLVNVFVHCVKGNAALKRKALSALAGSMQFAVDIGFSDEVIYLLRYNLPGAKIPSIMKSYWDNIEQANRSTVASFATVLLLTYVGRNASKGNTAMLRLLDGVPVEELFDILGAPRETNEQNSLLDVLLVGVPKNSAQALFELVERVQEYCGVDKIGRMLQAHDCTFTFMRSVSTMVCYKPNLTDGQGVLLYHMLNNAYQRFVVKNAGQPLLPKENVVATSMSSLGDSLKVNVVIPAFFFQADMYPDGFYKRAERYIRMQALTRVNEPLLMQMRELGLIDLSRPDTQKGIQFPPLSENSRSADKKTEKLKAELDVVWSRLMEFAFDDFKGSDGGVCHQKLAKSIGYGHESYLYLLKKLNDVGLIDVRVLASHISTKKAFETLMASALVTEQDILNNASKSNVRAHAMKKAFE